MTTKKTPLELAKANKLTTKEMIELCERQPIANKDAIEYYKAQDPDAIWVKKDPT